MISVTDNSSTLPYITSIRWCSPPSHPEGRMQETCGVGWDTHVVYEYCVLLIYMLYNNGKAARICSCGLRRFFFLQREGNFQVAKHERRIEKRG
jgi:hypothetical protein